MNYNQKVGQFGEDLAVKYLLKNKYKIIDRNVKISYKELDIIAKIKDKIIFVEVKTGQSKLTKREKSLKETIEKKRVGWKEINIDTADENTPDKEMENEENPYIPRLFLNIDYIIQFFLLEGNQLH